MAQDKEFHIIIGGIKESIANLESLEEALGKIEAQVREINDKGGMSVASKDSAKAMDELAKVTQKISDYDEDYQKVLQSTKQELQDKNKEIKQAIDLEKANATVQQGAASTYAEKQQLLGALGKVIKNTNADTDEQKQRQQELISQYAQLNQELKDFDATLGNHQRNVGDYKNSIKEAAEELRDIGAEANEAQERLAQMIYEGKGATKEFEELAKKAGELKRADELADQAMQRHISTMKGLDDVINVAQTATAAFELYSGAMSAFGLETEETEKALQKMMSAMSIIQSLQTLQETLTGNTASATLLSKALKVTGAELVTNQIAAIKATAAQEGMSKAQKAGAVASKTLGLALKAIPLMFIIGLVATLITHWEDVVGWFNKTFPVLNKLGGAFNALKAVLRGVGEAVLNWVVNPIKTMANVIQKIFEGDFEGAIKAAADGIKNQFKGTADAFKEGFQKQVESGLEEMTKKAAEESNKRTKQELAELKIQERNNKTYSKKYIALQKKDFAERKAMAKGNEEELNKIKLEEMQFFADVEDKKTAAAKAAASDRTKAAKEEAAKQKKIAEEEKKRRDKEYAANKKLYAEYAEYLVLSKELEIDAAKLNVEKYKKGPVEEYEKAVKQVLKLTQELVGLQRQAKLAEYFDDYRSNVSDASDDLDAFIHHLNMIMEESKEGTLNTNEAFQKFAKSIPYFSKLTKDQLTYLQAIAQRYSNDFISLKGNLDKTIRDGNKSVAEQSESIFKKSIDDITAQLNFLIKDLSKIDTSRISNWIHRLFNKKEAEKESEEYKQMWWNVFTALENKLPELEQEWLNYTEAVGKIHGKESKEYIEALQKQEEELKKFKKLKDEAQTNSQGASSTSNLGSQNSSSKRTKSQINPNENTTTDKGNTNWKALWNKDATVADNLLGNFKLLEESVLAPAMDTFTMFMDFALEETAQRLAEVQDMHDDALDKVEESADRIAELNDSLMDSNNTNMEATKQQLADEQLLYAQRLAEEKKLAEEEKALKNKQAQQEANARKMELRYQMVMGIANTAQGASKALADWGWPLGAIFAGVMAALGAVQVALIAKQIGQIKPVKYADGGLLSGPSHSQGGIKAMNGAIELEGNEYVVNKRNTLKYINVLNKINNNDPSVRYLQGGTTPQYADTKIRKFANGGLTPNFQRIDDNLRVNNETNKLMSAINDIDMHPIVSVVDIAKVQDRLTKVRSLAGHQE